MAQHLQPSCDTILSQKWNSILFFLFLALMGVFSFAASDVSRHVTTTDLLMLRDVDGVSISPDGRFVVFQVRRAEPRSNSYSNQWILIDTKTRRERVIVEDGGEPLFNSAGEWETHTPIWNSDSSDFYYTRKDRGQVTVHRASPNGGGEQMPVGNGDVVDLALSAKDVMDVVTEEVTEETKLAASDEYFRGRLFMPDDPLMARGMTNPITPLLGPPDFKPKKIRIGYDVDLKTGLILARPAASRTSYAPDSILQDIPDFRYAINNTISPEGQWHASSVMTKKKGAHGGKYAIYLVPSAGGEPAQLTPESDEAIRQLSWSSDGRCLYYLRKTNHNECNIFAADMETRTVKQVTKGAHYIRTCSFAEASPIAACIIEWPQRPAEIALVHLETGNVDILTELNHDFNRLNKSRFEKLAWTNKHGDELFGILTYPTNFRSDMRYPLIITTYRASGFLRGATGDEYPVAVFAANGSFVLSLDIHNISYVPLSIDQEQPFSVTLLQWQSPLSGIEQIVDQLNQRGLIDIRRIGICGYSHGAEIANYAISHSDIFAAAITHGGSARDPLFYYLKNESWHTLFKAWGLDGPPYGKNLVKWQQMSPALNAARINAPLLMNTPDKEYLAALQQYWEMRDHRKQVEMWVFPDEGHFKHQPIHRQVIYDRNVDWFNYWLRDIRDPDPQKADQYKRWDALRTERNLLGKDPSS